MLKKLISWTLFFFVKWGWRMISMDPDLWRRQISFVYNRKLWLSSTWKSSKRCSCMWRDIVCALPAFWNRIRHMIGNEKNILKNILFWKDIWVCDAPFQCLFPTSFRYQFLNTWGVKCSFTSAPWELYMLLKVKYFMWLCWKSNLNTRKVLNKKLDQNLGGCIIYNQTSKSFDHLFSNRILFSTVWKKSVQP